MVKWKPTCKASAINFDPMIKNCLSFLLFIAPVVGFSQDWELKKHENGIKVYTRPHPTSGFDSFKSVMTLNVPASSMVHFLQHIDEHPNAFPDTKELTILERPNDSTQIQYSVTGAPWPVSDRYGVFKLVFTTDRKTGVVTSIGIPVKGYVKDNDDMVRITDSDSKWIITPLGESKCQLEYIVSANPGGAIPEWLANSAAVDVPYETFINIRKELHK
ncbi:MAG: START domain-containing protein [Flavobacteriales bacterium]